MQSNLTLSEDLTELVSSKVVNSFESRNLTIVLVALYILIYMYKILILKKKAMSSILVFTKMVPALKEAVENFEQIIEKSYYENTSMKQIQIFNNIVNNIPVKLNSPNDMPYYTSLWCWNCALPFVSRPLYIPLNKLTDRHAIVCTYSCGSALVNIFSYKNKRLEMRMNLLRLLEFHHPNKKNYFIFEAPDKERMRHYGGAYTVEQYREIVNEYDRNMFSVCETQVEK
jgi:hypothetical protein